MQLGNFIYVFLARHVSGTYAHYQGALDVELRHVVLCTVKSEIIRIVCVCVCSGCVCVVALCVCVCV